MTRRAFSRWWAAALLGPVPALLPAGGRRADARGPEKKARGKADNRRGDGNADGSDTVDGALWQLTATKGGSGRRVSFTYRVSDLVIYDVASGAVIGKADRVRRGRGAVTLYKNSPLPGTFEIRRQRLSHWSGEMKSADGAWEIKLTCLDR